MSEWEVRLPCNSAGCGGSGLCYGSEAERSFVGRVQMDGEAREGIEGANAAVSVGILSKNSCVSWLVVPVTSVRIALASYRS